jgi:hypothetical protein
MTHTNVPTAQPPAGTDRTGGQSTTQVRPSRAFRIVSWTAALAALAIWIFGLTEIVLMWLSDDALVSLVGEGDPDPALLDYRSQFLHLGIVAWALVLPLLAQLRSPQRRVAPMLQLWLGAVALIVVGALAGVLEPLDIVILTVFSAIAMLHPARGELFRPSSVDRWQLAVLAVGLVPWLVRAGFAVQDAWDAGDLTVVEQSTAQAAWASVPLAVVVMLLAAAVGATHKSSWRLPAWTAAVAAVLIGSHALAFPEQAASLGTPWAVAAIAWGVAFGAATTRRSRRGA